MHRTLGQQINKRSPFASAQEEAMLNIHRTASHLSGPEHAFFRRYGLSPASYNLMRILRGHHQRGETGGMPASRIGCEMVVRMPDVTRLVDRLATMGLVCRAAHAADRRVKLVRITDKGLDLLAKMDPEVIAVSKELLGHMSREQLAQLSRLLELARNEQDTGESDEDPGVGA
ncbi:MAG: MarR family transcriptional regulator [Phycisphaerales bacterium]